LLDEIQHVPVFLPECPCFFRIPTRFCDPQLVFCFANLDPNATSRLNVKPIVDEQLKSRYIVFAQAAAVSYDIPYVIKLGKRLLHSFLTSDRVRETIPIRFYNDN
jgi:hypothetical protein